MREKKLLALFHAGHGGNVPRIERAERSELAFSAVDMAPKSFVSPVRLGLRCSHLPRRPWLRLRRAGKL
jgi:hypothetical protein